MYKSLVVLLSAAAVALAVGGYPGGPGGFGYNPYGGGYPGSFDPYGAIGGGYPGSFEPYNRFGGVHGVGHPGFNPYNNNHIRILHQSSDSQPNSYRYSYETENQIQAAEEGDTTQYDPYDQAGTRARGFYQYVDDKGQFHRVDYTADENGFRPVSKTDNLNQVAPGPGRHHTGPFGPGGQRPYGPGPYGGYGGSPIGFGPQGYPGGSPVPPFPIKK